MEAVKWFNLVCVCVRSSVRVCVRACASTGANHLVACNTWDNEARTVYRERVWHAHLVEMSLYLYQRLHLLSLYIYHLPVLVDTLRRHVSVKFVVIPWANTHTHTHTWWWLFTDVAYISPIFSHYLYVCCSWVCQTNWWVIWGKSVETIGYRVYTRYTCIRCGSTALCVCVLFKLSSAFLEPISRLFYYNCMINKVASLSYTITQVLRITH